MTSHERRFAGEAFRRRPEGDGGHLDPVHGAGAAERLGLPVLVQQSDLRTVDIEMPRVGGKVQWLEGAAALLVQDVERLDEAQVVAHLREGAIPAAAVVVHHIGGAADRGEDAVVASEGERARGIARGERKVRGDGGEPLGDQRRIEAHGLGGDIGARAFVERARFRIENPHAEFRQHLQRRVMERRDMVGAENFDGRVGPDHPSEGPLDQAAARARRAGAAAPSFAHSAARRSTAKSRGAKGASRPTWISDAARPSSRAVLWP